MKRRHAISMGKLKGGGRDALRDTLLIHLNQRSRRKKRKKRRTGGKRRRGGQEEALRGGKNAPLHARVAMGETKSEEQRVTRVRMRSCCERV